MARSLEWDEVKQQIHESGLTIEQIADFMKISTTTFWNRYSGEVDTDDIQNLNDAIKVLSK